MLSRRSFLAKATASVGVGAGAWAMPGCLQAAGASWVPSAAPRRWLLEVLPARDKTYDPLAKMLVVPAKTVAGYPWNVRSPDVHGLRPSLAYAAALLDTGASWRLERAREILRAVVALQDQDPQSQTYGQWPWALEAPLSQALPREPQEGDIATALLLGLWRQHRGLLGSELEGRIQAALLHTARAVGQHPAPLHHTRAALMECGLLLVAARELKQSDLRPDARDRLHRVYAGVMQQGSFADYNSPLDTIVTLQELSRLLLVLEDARDHTLIRELRDLAWKHAATHFHPPTQQWAGPHSRNTETNLAALPATLAFLQEACGTQATFQRSDARALSLEAYALPLHCPRKWATLFATQPGPRQVTETFVQGEPAIAGARNPLVGTTWLHPRLALGSINRGDFWQERRPLVAYWGTPLEPRFLRVRFLTEDQDFSSALLFSTQHEGNVLAVVVLASDHGARHPERDPLADATIRSRELRLSFRFGGDLTRCFLRRWEDDEDALLVQDEQVRFIVRPVLDRFGNERFRWDRPELKLADEIQAVAYRGEEKQFELLKLGDCFACFTLSAWPREQKPPDLGRVQTRLANGRLQARWTVEGRTHDLEIPVRPGPFAELNDAFRGIVV